MIYWQIGQRLVDRSWIGTRFADWCWIGRFVKDWHRNWHRTWLWIGVLLIEYRRSVRAWQSIGYGITLDWQLSGFVFWFPGLSDRPPLRHFSRTA